MGVVKDEVGNRYGRLIVVEMLPPRLTDRNHFALARCTCDCGNETITRGSNLRRGDTSSCGCLQKETAAKYRRTSRKASVRDEVIKRKHNEYSRNAKKRGVEFSLSLDQFFSLCSGKCSYCGCDPKEVMRSTTVGGIWKKVSTGVFMHGVDRINSSIGYVNSNVTSCCWLCNQSKNNIPLDEFKSLVARQYAFMSNKSKEKYMGLDTQDVSYMEAA